MKFNRVLLVRFPYHTYLGDASSLPVGLGYIAESLEGNSIEYNVFDMGLDYNENQLLQKVNDYSPDLIGITMMTMHHLFHYKIIENIKRLHPNIKFAVGGAHSSTYREKMLEECPAIDYGVVLEGDETIVELCKGKSLNEMKGIIYRDRDKIIYNGDREFIKDLDTIPFPKYNKFEIDKYLAGTFGIHTTRGCPYDCIYCPVKTAIGRKFRVRSPQSVINEIDYWYKKGHRDFAMWDDNFTFLPKRVYEICDLLEQNNLKNLNIALPNGIRGDKADFQLLKKMRQVGFNMISFGVESANNHILMNLKKGTKIEIIEDGVKNACELGYQVCLYFMIGSPCENWQDFERSLNFAEKYPVIFQIPNYLIGLRKTIISQGNPKNILIQQTILLTNHVFLLPNLALKSVKKLLKKAGNLPIN